MTDAADLAKVGSGTDGCDSDSSYLQTADITLTGSWTPITSFTGTYDGGDHTISGLTVSVGGSGGLFGSTSTGALIRRTHLVDVSVTGGDKTGGLVGELSEGTVEDVTVTGTVTGANSVGGIAGDSFDSTLTRVGSDETVTGSRTVGGLVGLIHRGSVTASYSTAAVSIDEGSETADPNLGGLVGAMVGVTVTDVYARGDLTNPAVADDVGGLVGDTGNSSPDNVIERAYSTGAVPGTADSVGGLAGGPNGDVHRDSFWDTVTSGQTTSRAGTGKTTAELTTISTFNDTATDGLATAWPIVAGWQPYIAGTRVWGICERVNDGYPFLLWQYDSDPCTVPAAAPPAAAPGPTLAVTCPTDAAGTLPVGAPITCTLTGGDPDIDILWRAAHNPTFAEGVIRTGTDGTGTIPLTIPPAAAGSPITVELVAWTAPLPIGTAAGGPVPSAIPAGGGPGERSGPAVVLLGLLAALAVRASVVARQPSAARRPARRVRAERTADRAVRADRADRADRASDTESSTVDDPMAQERIPLRRLVAEVGATTPRRLSALQSVPHLAGGSDAAKGRGWTTAAAPRARRSNVCS